MGRGLAPLALSQLDQWEAVARIWPVVPIGKDTGLHLCCANCRMTVIQLGTVAGTYYYLKVGDIIAATVAHLRNVHRDMESIAYGYGSENPQSGTDAGIGSAGSRDYPGID